MALDAFTRAEQIARDFTVSAKHLRDATPLFVEQLREGLRKDDTALLQVPSFVTRLPTGSERGTCLAIDLGGTNLRVLKVRFHGDSTYSLQQAQAAVPLQVLTADTHTALFGFIADRTHAFLREHLPEELDRRQSREGSSDDSEQHKAEKLAVAERLPVSFTFSFSFNQYAINRGSLLFWTKAFNIQDAVGRDPCVMLQEALDERGLPLKVSALVNDTTGVLAARAYCRRSSSRSTGPLLGAVFGTGTNGAYMERRSSITKLQNPAGERRDDDSCMAINTEWGGFDQDLLVLPSTEFDDELDRESVNPRREYYEKRISGLYLGELWRLAMLSLVERGDKPTDGDKTDPLRLFSLPLPRDTSLLVPYSIDSSLLSDLVRDTSFTLRRARKRVAQVLGTQALPSRREARVMRSVAEAIGRRAARLSAVAIAGVALQSGRAEPSSRRSSRYKCTAAQGVKLIDDSDLSPSVTPPLRDIASSTVEDPFSASVRRHSASYSVADLLRCCLCFPFLLGQSLTPLFPLPRRRRRRLDIIDWGKPTEEDDVIDIGVDGSLYEHYPGFERELRAALREIPQIGRETESKIEMSLVRDGSGVGAAIIALLYA